jgi:dipeptidyl aminopeptidase/acylaminoacyl peptidase
LLAACAASPSPPTTPAPAAAPPTTGYDRPPDHVLRVLHAPDMPRPLLSPREDVALLVSWVRHPPITQVAEPFLKLAGVRVEPRTRRKHDTRNGYGIAPCAREVSLVDVASGKTGTVSLPAGGCADNFVWSADGQRFAFRNTSHDAVELWVGERSGATRRLADVRLNPLLGS